MNIQIDNCNIFSTLKTPDQLLDKIPLIFLHGFSGCSDNWQQVINKIDDRYFPFGIDLIGHGKSSSPGTINSYTHDALASQLESVFRFYNITESVICGYSMGGRAALNFTIKYPHRVKAIILESASPGIINTAERDTRYKSDLALADEIEQKGIEYFTEYWSNLPMFSTQKNLPALQFDKVKASRLKNNVTGLSNSLRGFSAGIMPNYWNRLPKITCPVLLITGQLDEKYTKINRNMHGLIKNSELKIIDSCGHNTHLEKPVEFVSLVNSFLRNLIE